jgi:hypothetical protein
MSNIANDNRLITLFHASPISQCKVHLDIEDGHCPPLDPTVDITKMRMLSLGEILPKRITAEDINSALELRGYRPVSLRELLIWVKAGHWDQYTTVVATEGRTSFCLWHPLEGIGNAVLDWITIRSDKWYSDYRVLALPKG